MNPLLKEFRYCILKNIKASMDQLESYNDCPHDPYMGNGTRYKRFSQFKIEFLNGRWDCHLLPHRDYTAYKKFNPIGGGYIRKYEPIKADFTNIIKEIIINLDLDKDFKWQINVHQNRSIANKEKSGLLTPEGRHTDGHEFVSISVFSRSNISGGITRLWEKKDSKEPIIEHTLQPGETILLHDTQVMHDVTDITQNGDTQGSRDILIIAYSKWNERWYGEEHDKNAISDQDN